mmetsp:Transcript_14433/g.40950  ORF Transcript_14433/g.40950 Transcript_14433/m.40950 type:complete len:296 (+) Transcript_14433:334-1221(+)
MVPKDSTVGAAKRHPTVGIVLWVRHRPGGMRLRRGRATAGGTATAAAAADFPWRGSEGAMVPITSLVRTAVAYPAVRVQLGPFLDALRAVDGPSSRLRPCQSRSRVDRLIEVRYPRDVGHLLSDDVANAAGRIQPAGHTVQTLVHLFFGSIGCRLDTVLPFLLESLGTCPGAIDGLLQGAWPNAACLEDFVRVHIEAEDHRHVRDGLSKSRSSAAHTAPDMSERGEDHRAHPRPRPADTSAGGCAAGAARVPRGLRRLRGASRQNSLPQVDNALADLRGPHLYLHEPQRYVLPHI